MRWGVQVMASKARDTQFVSAELFRTLFEQSPEGILITDLQGNFIECNKVAYTALGYSREEFEQLELSSLIGLPANNIAAFGNDEIPLDRQIQYETRQQGKNGITRDVLATIRRITASGRSLLYTTWHDTSDCTRVKAELQESIKNLEREKAKTEAIVHAIGEGISIRDRDFRILYENQVTIDTLGDHKGQLCYRALQGREKVCDGCPVVLSFEDGRIHTAERHTRTQDGVKYFESTASPIMDEEGNIVAAIELVRNITEKKQSEHDLRQANARMEALLNAIPDLVLFKDAQRRLLLVNRAVELSTGLSRDELLGKVDEDFSPPEVAAMCRASDEKAMNAQGPLHSEESVIGKNGETIYLDTIKAPMHDEHGNLAGVVMVSRDITERKKAEEALRLSGQRMFEAQRMAHVGNWQWRLDKDELYWSDEVYHIYGRTPETFTPTFTSVRETMIAADLDPFLLALESALEKGKPFEMDYRITQPDGTVRTIHTIGEVERDPLGNPIGMSGTVQDITERKLLEAMAREQHATLASIIESTDSPIFSVDRNYCYTSFNRQHASVMHELYGAKVEFGKNVLDCITNEEDQRKAKFGLDSALKGEKVLTEEFYGSGEQRCLFESSFNPILDGNDQVVGVALYARDTTERKRAEEQLRASEKRLRDITENLGAGVYVLDDSGSITFMNPMAEQLWGWSIEELQEKGVHNLVHHYKADGTPLPQEDCEVHRVIDKGQPYISADEVFVRKDGTVFPVSIITTPLMEGDKVVASVTAFRDISAEKKFEEELHKIQKLESVGILAGGIAHDFNNLLQTILGGISLARLHLDQAKVTSVPTLLEQAEEAIHAAKELSFRLLTFAKGGDPIKKMASLEKIVGKSVSLSLSGSNLACNQNFHPDLPLAEVDAGQLMQVFNNILINAKEAMPQGGTIHIIANTESIGEDSPLPLMQGNYLRISIQDSGCGIAAEHLPRIFDPYFSMKGMGNRKGSGLGLSICMAIVRKHEGHISVESRPDEGTTFHIYLPCSPLSSAGQEEGEEGFVTEKKRLLFMDDDDRVRTLVMAMVTSLGYEVECARHGEEAVTLYRDRRTEGRPFAGVILDLTVKGGSGGDKAVSSLRRIDPQVKAAIASGYAENPVVKNYREYGFVGALTKPFTMNQLKDLIATLLEPEAASAESR